MVTGYAYTGDIDPADGALDNGIEDADWDSDAITDTVVMGLFWLPVSKNSSEAGSISPAGGSPGKRAGARANALAMVGKLFGREAPEGGKGGGAGNRGRDLAQTARAVVLDRAMALWRCNVCEC